MNIFKVSACSISRSFEFYNTMVLNFQMYETFSAILKFVLVKYLNSF
jgi:hypothetical protein